MQSSPAFARIGTRGSPLALAQARLVRSLLASAHGVSEDDIAIEVLSTGGDRSQASNASLSEIGGKGLFTKEIDDAMLSGRIDIGVHSSKDVATRLPDGLALVSFLEREDVRDAFMSVKVQSLDHLGERAKFGTSSIRRAAQVLRQRPDLVVVPFRGNVGTRLQKLIDGVADATLLAMAGLNRLEEGHRATGQLDPEIFLPAPAQGAIGLAVRSDDARMAQLVGALNHAPTDLAITAERAMLAHLDGSCRTPIAGLAEFLNDGRLRLRGLVAHPEGRHVVSAQAEDDRDNAAALGLAVGRRLKEQMGEGFLE